MPIRQNLFGLLEPGGFETFCHCLNERKSAPDALPHFDGMSGGFKFEDEIPESFRLLDTDRTLAYVGALRVLWRYRRSLVCGLPRNDLASFWEAVVEAAPNWPGFAAERHSKSMLPFALECESRAAELSLELDELDRRIRDRQLGRDTCQPQQ